MLMPKFDHGEARSLRGASLELSGDNGKSLLYAGGTDLIPRLKYGLASAEKLIGLKSIPPRPPKLNGGGDLILDALTVLNDLAADQLVREHSPMLALAALSVASNQVRNWATLGGNLCQETRCLYYNQSHAYQFVEPCFKRGGELCYLVPKGKKCWAVFMSDLAPALITLQSWVELIRGEEVRVLSLDKMYSGDSAGPLALERGEIVSRVMIPPLPRGSGWAFTKFSLRGGMEFAGFSLAAVITGDRDSGTCLGAELTCGAIGGGPLRVEGLGECWPGKSPARSCSGTRPKRWAMGSGPIPTTATRRPTSRRS